jgi:para-nitrobenzyl esterase
MKNIAKSTSCVIAFSFISLAAIAQEKNPVIKIDSRILKGSVENGVISYKGIPFAAPPIGNLRWRAPQPAKPWNGILDATKFRNDCMQSSFPNEIARDAAPLGTPPSEDCLYANIWRPEGKDKNLPVLVWIYGGGFVNGGGSAPVYSGEELARKGILFFSFNYRLGRLGTYAHPQLTSENLDNGQLVAYNHMDQISALRWVKRNIKVFGGNPDNVTVIGESAGGRSIHTLITSPQTKGLFDRAVIQSGGLGDNVRADGSLNWLEGLGVQFAESKGISASDPKSLEKMRALPAEEIIDGISLSAYFGSGKPPASFSTLGWLVQDGKVTVDSMAAYKSGNFRHVPVMVGSTSADLGGKTGYMAVGARNVAQMLTAQGVPVYYYRFSYVAHAEQTPDNAGATHASDIPFFFRTLDRKLGHQVTQADMAVEELASNYLVNFVKTGNPNEKGLPLWSKYEEETDSMLDFSAQGSAVPGEDPRRHDLNAVSRQKSGPTPWKDSAK